MQLSRSFAMYLSTAIGLGQPANIQDSERGVLKQLLETGLSVNSDVYGQRIDMPLPPTMAKLPYSAKHIPEAQEYWRLPEHERKNVTDIVDRVFREATGISRKLDPKNPKELPWIRTWLRLRDRIMVIRNQKTTLSPDLILANLPSTGHTPQKSSRKITMDEVRLIQVPTGWLRVEIGPKSVEFYRNLGRLYILRSLAGQQGFIWATNNEARNITKEFFTLFHFQEHLKKVMQFIRKHNKTRADIALHMVINAERIIRKKTTGRKGELLRDAIDKFTRATGEFDGILHELRAKGYETVAATKAVDAAKADVDLQAAKGQISKVQGKIANEKEKREKIEQWVIKITKTATDLLLNPKSALDIVVDAGLYVGEQLFKESIGRDILTELKTELEQAKEKLLKLEDEKLLAVMQGAEAKVRASLEAHRAAEKKAVQAAKDVASYQKRAFEILRERPETSKVADAIEERRIVLGKLTQSLQGLTQFQDQASRLQKRMETIQRVYLRAADLVIEKANEIPPIYSNQIPRILGIGAAALKNIDTLRNYIARIKPMQNFAGPELAYLNNTKDEVRSIYDKIPEYLTKFLQ
jgi:hypothetical protein